MGTENRVSINVKNVYEKRRIFDHYPFLEGIELPYGPLFLVKGTEAILDEPLQAENIKKTRMEWGIINDGKKEWEERTNWAHAEFETIGEYLYATSKEMDKRSKFEFSADFLIKTTEKFIRVREDDSWEYERIESTIYDMREVDFKAYYEKKLLG